MLLDRSDLVGRFVHPLRMPEQRRVSRHYVSEGDVSLLPRGKTRKERVYIFSFSNADCPGVSLYINKTQTNDYMCHYFCRLMLSKNKDKNRPNYLLSLATYILTKQKCKVGIVLIMSIRHMLQDYETVMVADQCCGQCKPRGCLVNGSVYTVCLFTAENTYYR